MSHLENASVAVIGGGIGGLAAALAFSRFGAAVTVYEQAEELTEVGAGIQITPNGGRVLAAMGLSGQLDACSLRAQAVQPRDGLTGRAITRFDLGDQTPPYRFFHRAALIDLLATACRQAGVTVHLGARIDAVTTDGTVRTEQGEQPHALVVGADGLHSGARGLLNGQGAPFFTGQVAWRGIVAAPDVPPVANIWMAPSKHVVTYPLKGDLLNVVAVQERADWAAEGWHHDDAPANLQAAFADTCAELKGLIGQVETPKLWGLFRHPVAQHWHRDRLAILGDAAHPTLPFLAQGANLALEDAWTLAACCASAPMAEALPAYQGKRAQRVTRAIAAANANAKNYHLDGLQRRIAHAGLRTLGTLAPNAFLKRLSWLYDHDVTASFG
ncbi:FAD-dependent monooxygenase [Sulfitobacter pseudonitzschiae]|uniref:FAD-dependent monooxygenase n=1 Tax=Pseudosulfitobacter pseudonitzschiae TaxID=1402135 RepID=A0A9Q2RYX6_9RHOB|nr:FAD-dependent monooxygenase [Pseudosulfitobacter pseudonitzschiae]MBM2291041.1 FAD-dependent monooxygenase [Pseudosulfitobacter pseudonitzschiae]MBM2295959.1 FAD-dependent monooxygenase [Pseudosulfitobacter pseudonitzschiae]MBM2300872.1 FAD-dependent monooxygenase [Pseudosulfitobacter pseudonitzschiae]MBM2310656.1 FAD-dependent monooxygenase [Pseudosulfitobacter pseudonitzschiae]MBM2315569.1 FAD-dependent monooxygenase [Pseudosulfitobacter pseudonitzschiae]